MNRMLDTDILVDLLRRHPPAWDWFSTLRTAPAVPAFAGLEVFEGCRSAAHAREVRQLLRRLPVAWLSTNGTSRVYKSFVERRLRHGLGLMDALIGETALEQDAVLSTFNAKHFRCIPGLVLEQPYRH